MHTRTWAEGRLAALRRDLADWAGPDLRARPRARITAEDAMVDRVAGWLIWLRRRHRHWASSARRALIEEVARRAPRPPGAAYGPPLWGRVWAVRIARPERGTRPQVEIW